ncbi:MAG: single-stranded DNA-binding protein [Thermoanaerobacteraceae bacterium]|nr:single-stranded DNA-binding protein [Thermoanaerobacteraceae bacterium]
MINNVVLVGRLTKDPELKKAGDIPTCSFTLAVDRNFTNSEGEREADFIQITVWRKLAEICSTNLAK